MFRVFRERETLFLRLAIDDQKIARPKLICCQQRG